MILFRPVGTEELKLIRESGNKRFPPRLPEQPIFYPVLNEEYAIEIASKWNAVYNAEHKGYVTRFEVDDDYVSRYETHIVGSTRHEELWVPSEELEEFNDHIKGQIEVTQEFGP